MIALDSPLWSRLESCYPQTPVVELVRQIVDAGDVDEGWDELLPAILHQGSVYPATSAVLPHVVAVAAAQPPTDLDNFWIDIGLLVAAGAGRFPPPVPEPGLDEGLASAVRQAEGAAVRSFLVRSG